MRPTHTYARHAQDRMWHRIDRVENGSLVTVCRGRWSTRDSWIGYDGESPLAPFVVCAACTVYPAHDWPGPSELEG